MTRPARRRRDRIVRLSPYKRLERELANSREALTTAATLYTDALQALMDAIAMLDASSFGGGKTYRCLTPLELTRLEEIRRVAEGK